MCELYSQLQNKEQPEVELYWIKACIRRNLIDIQNNHGEYFEVCPATLLHELHCMVYSSFSYNRAKHRWHVIYQTSENSPLLPLGHLHRFGFYLLKKIKIE